MYMFNFWVQSVQSAICGISSAENGVISTLQLQTRKKREKNVKDL